MKLWLLRHGEAEPHAASDAQRRLTERGIREVRQSAEQLCGAGVQRVLVSPYRRAQETAQLVMQVTGLDCPLVTVDWLTPDSDPQWVINQFDDSAEVLLLVAHQPLLGELAGLLLHGHRGDPQSFRTAGLLALQGPAAMAGLMERGRD
ncbi:phosphohistidine phosphatase SixA [Pseudomonas sp. HAR-UPW-AIA-41]|uniref:phosphohistidine phosphatase SixA n=1 Tax=Pseudomonas sp. HAR-UPW-AIA-41 TaxID=1985301 RepID=UPI000BB2DB64|nr:phosphohistidine phosphatase SixA [Pseudomonas sp. HAR-UPW-AIA-41]PAV49707.1 phosphohistidine phosphatase SixA [Pseudomonas sp. HAR-UPW-AIA-41]